MKFMDIIDLMDASNLDLDEQFKNDRVIELREGVLGEHTVIYMSTIDDEHINDSNFNYDHFIFNDLGDRPCTMSMSNAFQTMTDDKSKKIYDQLLGEQTASFYKDVDSIKDIAEQNGGFLDGEKADNALSKTKDEINYFSDLMLKNEIACLTENDESLNYSEWNHYNESITAIMSRVRMITDSNIENDHAVADLVQNVGVNSDLDVFSDRYLDYRDYPGEILSTTVVSAESFDKTRNVQIDDDFELEL